MKVATWLVLDYPLFARDVVHHLHSRGIRTKILDPRTLDLNGFVRTATEWKPEAIFGINFSPPIAALAGALGIPYVSWTIDPLPNSRFELMDWTRPDLCLSFAHRKATVQRLCQLGMDALFLPLAAPSGRRVPITDSEQLRNYRGSISFVGASLSSERELMEQELRPRLGEVGLQRLLSWAQDIAPSLSNNPTSLGMATTPLPDWLSSILPEEEVQRVAELLDGELARLHRLECITQLQSFGIQVWGDAAWENHITGYRGAANHGDELTCIYNATHVNLDIPRLYQRDIVTMRVFDALACRAFLLTEESEQLAEHLVPGKEVGGYRCPQTLASKVRHFLDNPEERQEIADCGHRRVIAEHQMDHRVDTIIAQTVLRGFSKPRDPGSAPRVDARSLN